MLQAFFRKPETTNTAIQKFPQFDGLRGLATIMVVLYHCNILIHGGGIANALFFVLAGFFLINPLKDKNEQRFSSFWGIVGFYKSRAIRIMPAYYLVLLLVFIQSGYYWIPKERLIQLLYFGDIWGHLWFISDYFWITFFIPFIMLTVQLIARKIRLLNNDLALSLIFFVMAGLNRITLLLMGISDIRLGQMMIGISCGYLCRYIKNSSQLKASVAKNEKCANLLTILVCVMVFVASSKRILSWINSDLSEISVGWEYLFASAFVMSILILLVYLYPTSFLGNILKNDMLIFVGCRSYSIYLINYFLMLQLRDKIHSDIFLFICVFSTSVVLAHLLDMAISKTVSLLKKICSCKSLKGSSVKTVKVKKSKVKKYKKIFKKKNCGKKVKVKK